MQKRKLLLHKREIKKLKTKLAERGYTLIPLKIYFNDDGKAKCLLGLCRGKKKYDKREDVKKRDVERDIQRKYKLG
jgi:SsrA-binding protein